MLIGIVSPELNYLPRDANNPRWPTKQGVSQIHWDEFGEHGLPPEIFGGTLGGKTFRIPPLGSKIGVQIINELSKFETNL